MVQGQRPRGRECVGLHRLVRTIKMADAEAERPVSQGVNRWVGEPLQRADPGDRLVSSTMASSSLEKPSSEATDAPSWAAWQVLAAFCPVSSCTRIATSNSAKVLTPR